MTARVLADGYTDRLTDANGFLPRCMECKRGLAMRILSVRLSVKRVDCDTTEKDLSRFLYHTKYHSA